MQPSYLDTAIPFSLWVAGLVGLYLLLAFVNLDFNVYAWGFFGRTVYVVFGLVWSYAVVASAVDEK